MGSIDKLVDAIYENFYSVAQVVDGERYSWDEVKKNAVEVKGERLKFIPFMCFYLEGFNWDMLAEIVLKGKHGRTREQVGSAVCLGPSPATGFESWFEKKCIFEKYAGGIGKRMTPEEISTITGRSVKDDVTIALAWYSNLKYKNDGDNGKQE